MSPAGHNSEDAGDGAYGLSSLSEKTRISNHLQISLQRQHILLSYFKTLSVGPVWGSNPRPLSSYSLISRSRGDDQYICQVWDTDCHEIVTPVHVMQFC